MLPLNRNSTSISEKRYTMFTSQICYYITIIINSIYNVLLEIRSFSVKSSLLIIDTTYFISHMLFYNVILLINVVSKFIFIRITHLSKKLVISNGFQYKMCFSTTVSGIIYLSSTYQLTLLILFFKWIYDILVRLNQLPCSIVLND